MNPYDPVPSEKRFDESPECSPRTMRSALLLAVAALLLAPILGLWVLARPAFDRTLLSRVTPGMSRTQVSTILGPRSGDEGPSQWEYWRWGNAGWVEIAFDNTDTVIWVNDESVFP